MEKDFIAGKCDIKTFENGGKMIKVSIPAEEVKRILKDGWINFDIKYKKNPVEGKSPIYMENNTWQPAKNPADSMKQGIEQVTDNFEIPTEQIPF